MSKYFKFFPTTNYPFTDDNTIVTTVTNVLKRMRVRPELEQNISFYQTYLVKGHDTPEIVSEKAYADTKELEKQAKSFVEFCGGITDPNEIEKRGKKLKQKTSTKSTYDG